MNHIDIKVTVWTRLSFTDDTNMEEIVEQIQQCGVDEVIDDAKGFIQSETLYETEEQLTPEENSNASTIEVYGKNKLLWENGEGVLKQDE